jgi:exopolysaccharide biosynthesis polyprenyl glycosylphosphotransferase
MLNSSLNLKRAILIIGDVAVFALSLLLTLIIRYGEFHVSQWNAHLLPFGVLTLPWIATFYIAGMYDLTLGRDPLRFFRTFLEAMLANFALSLGFFYLLPIFGIAPRTNLVLLFALALLLGYAWRLVCNRLIFKRFEPGRVLYIGPGGLAQEILKLLQASPLGMNLTTAIATDHEEDHRLTVTWNKELANLPDLLKRERVSAIVLGISPDENQALKQELYASLFSPVVLLDRAEIEEATTGRIPLSYVSETWFLHHLREFDKSWYESLKRVTDLAFALPIGLVTLALWPLVSLAIKVSSPGPVLFSQIRVGLGGKTFRIWKFRSMHMDSEKNGPQFTADAKTDPRLFTVGRWLRRLRLDELPQVWNLLRGDLSLIGPRPERPEFVAPLIERMPFYQLRHLTRPGLTGWAQVQFLTPTASLEDNLKKLQYDLYYIKHRSPLLDLAILLKTIGVMLRRQGT